MSSSLSQRSLLSRLEHHPHHLPLQRLFHHPSRICLHDQSRRELKHRDLEQEHFTTMQLTRTMKSVSLNAPLGFVFEDFSPDVLSSTAFNEGDEIVDIQFDSDDWWSGSVEGKRGL